MTTTILEMTPETNAAFARDDRTGSRAASARVSSQTLASSPAGVPASLPASGTSEPRRTPTGPAAAPSKVGARVSVRYCRFSNHARVAEELASSLRDEFSAGRVQVELVPASGGVYEVSVNGRLVFSKRATTRIPEADEIAYHVRTALGQQPKEGPFVPPSG